jgi:ribosomal protein S18 acetylase RimI-like enzyme
MTAACVIRLFEESDFDRVHEINVSERIELTYRFVDGVLQSEAHDWQRPPWDRSDWQERLSEWRTNLQPDVWLGAFVADQIAGLASLRYQLAPRMAQLTTLHVNRAHRRQGVARELVERVAAMAEARGSDALYVSATESESAVGFYLSRGFRPTNTPDPKMFDLEPNDIHMVRRLNRRRPE